MLYFMFALADSCAILEWSKTMFHWFSFLTITHMSRYSVSCYFSMTSRFAITSSVTTAYIFEKWSSLIRYLIDSLFWDLLWQAALNHKYLKFTGTNKTSLAFSALPRNIAYQQSAEENKIYSCETCTNLGYIIMGFVNYNCQTGFFFQKNFYKLN